MVQATHSRTGTSPNRDREPGLTIMQAIEKRKEPAWFTLLIPVAGTCSVLLSGLRTIGSNDHGDSGDLSFSA